MSRFDMFLKKILLPKHNEKDWKNGERASHDEPRESTLFDVFKKY